MTRPTAPPTASLPTKSEAMGEAMAMAKSEAMMKSQAIAMTKAAQVSWRIGSA